MTALQQIRQIDYTVIFARNMAAMRAFYESVLGFGIGRTLGEDWIEYPLGGTVLALTRKGALFTDAETPDGALSLQLAFRVDPATVSDCADALAAKGVELILPLTDQPWGHRTIFFRDPDGNVIEIYAEI